MTTIPICSKLGSNTNPGFRVKSEAGNILKMTINFDAPFNPTSIGQTSYNIYKQLAKNNDICLFPQGDSIDLGCFNVKDEEKQSIQRNSHFSEANYDRNNPSVSIWHIRGSEKAIGARQNLLTFHETDFLTKYEINRLSQLSKIFVSSKYTKEIFDFYLNGAANVIYCPLAFDSDSFGKIDKDTQEGVITFGLRGKLEKRKHTLKVMAAWAKTFGGDPRYRLDCSIHNFFMGDEQLREIHRSMPDQTMPWNINILPFLPTNDLYNRCLNQADIDLTGMSGCEGFNLPLFQSLCLGKQAVVLNAHVHKDFCNSDNSILVEPSGMIEADDGKFFVKGQPINQGRWFDFYEKDLIDAMVFAAEKGLVNNDEGEKLKDWTFEKTAQIIKDNI